jgi:hypothetical protein
VHTINFRGDLFPGYMCSCSQNTTTSRGICVLGLSLLRTELQRKGPSISWVCSCSENNATSGRDTLSGFVAALHTPQFKGGSVSRAGHSLCTPCTFRGIWFEGFGMGALGHMTNGPHTKSLMVYYGNNLDISLTSVRLIVTWTMTMMILHFVLLLLRLTI